MAKNLNGKGAQDFASMRQVLQPDVNFDIVERELLIGGKQAYFYNINGFVSDENVQKIIQFFLGVKAEQMPSNPELFLEGFTAFGDVKLEKEVEKLVTAVLSGLGALIIDGFDQGFVFDIRNYPSRGVQEPDKDRVLRGSRDGFSETIISNTALIRRRIRDPKLRLEIYQAGQASKTDIALIYMEGRVDEPLLAKIKNRIQNLKVDALTMNQESLAECLYTHKWYNPFPKFKYTERPDTAAACLLEGNLVILVDNSPAAMILPSSVFDIAEAPDDYYFPPLTGTYLRLTRILTAFVALFLIPIYLLLMQNTHWLPEWLDFIRPAENVNVPLIFQILILELAVDGLRLASVNTPSMLSTPLSIIAGIVMGDFSVQSGWFNSEIMLYMAFVTVANYTQTSYELGYAIKFLRLSLVILTSLFNVWGFAAGMALVLVAIVTNRTIAGTSYLYPLIPFHWREVKKRFFRPRLSYEIDGKKQKKSGAK